MQPQVISGARVLCKINNQGVAGFVLDYQIDTEGTVLQGIDNIFPDEIAPNNVMAFMTLRVYRTPDNDPVAARFAPGGDQAGAQADFTESPYVTIEVRDRVTDKTVLYFPKAWIAKRSGSVEAQGLLAETWSVKGIGFFGPGQQTSGLLPVLNNIFS